MTILDNRNLNFVVNVGTSKNLGTGECMAIVKNTSIRLALTC